MSNYKYLTSAGVVIPDTADLLESVRDEWRTALGFELDVSDSTPQGVLIAAETRARVEVVKNNADLANQIDPNQAGGIYLDAVCKLTDLSRTAATRSILRNVVLTGRPGVIVPAASQASVGQNGPIFESVGAAIFDDAGRAVINFQAVETGPIAVGAHTLDTPVSGGVLGWETVQNPTAAELGHAKQSDVNLRELRKVTLAKQTVSLVEAVVSRLNATPGVRSIAFRENVSSETQVIDNVTLGPHSIWACVDGGTDIDVDTALLDSKSNGSGWNGATEVLVLEPFSRQKYSVVFDRPIIKTVRATVYVSQGTASNSPFSAIPDAIVRYANGDDSVFGRPGFAVGENVSSFELSGAINMLYPGFFVRKIEVGLLGGSMSPAEVHIELFEKAFITSDLVQVIMS